MWRWEACGRSDKPRPGGGWSSSSGSEYHVSPHFPFPSYSSCNRTSKFDQTSSNNVVRDDANRVMKGMYTETDVDLTVINRQRARNGTMFNDHADVTNWKTLVFRSSDLPIFRSSDLAISQPYTSGMIQPRSS